MIKRLLDIVISLIGLICFSPILFFVSILVWRNDKKSPFYIPPRVGKKGTKGQQELWDNLYKEKIL
jgi:lipopolysaccharide/colanic/teichoic acid biosynthesis glycosyltransferase